MSIIPSTPVYTKETLLGSLGIVCDCICKTIEELESGRVNYNQRGLCLVFSTGEQSLVLAWADCNAIQLLRCLKAFV
jgi:hypothetical protein